MKGRGGERERPRLNLSIHSRSSPSSLHLFQQRDGCPRIVNLGQARVDLFFDKKRGGRVGGGIA